MKKRTGKYSWELEDSDYTKLDQFITGPVCDVWQSVLNKTINLVNARRNRKVKIKIDKYDTWSMDSTLSMIVLPMLKQLQETKHGSPGVDDEDVPEGLGLRSTEAAPLENDWDTDENWHKRWDWVMSELIWTFEQLNDDNNDDQFHTGNLDIQWDPLDGDGNPVPKAEATQYEMNKGPDDTHVFDKVGYTAHHERIAKGLVLFGKYYRGLWD